MVFVECGLYNITKNNPITPIIPKINKVKANVVIIKPPYRPKNNQLKRKALQQIRHQ